MTGDDERIARSSRRLLAPTLVTLAGLLGMAGVVVSAAAAHRGGSPLAETAGMFLLLHAAAGLGLAAVVQRGGRAVPVFAFAGLVLLVGTALFAGDLALAGIFARHPWPLAAPVGGGAMVMGWALVGVGGVVGMVRA